MHKVITNSTSLFSLFCIYKCEWWPWVDTVMSLWSTGTHLGSTDVSLLLQIQTLWAQITCKIVIKVSVSLWRTSSSCLEYKQGWCHVFTDVIVITLHCDWPIAGVGSCLWDEGQWALCLALRIQRWTGDIPFSFKSSHQQMIPTQHQRR